VIYRMK